MLLTTTVGSKTSLIFETTVICKMILVLLQFHIFSHHFSSYTQDRDDMLVTLECHVPNRRVMQPIPCTNPPSSMKNEFKSHTIGTSSHASLIHKSCLLLILYVA